MRSFAKSTALAVLGILALTLGFLACSGGGKSPGQGSAPVTPVTFGELILDAFPPTTSDGSVQFSGSAPSAVTVEVALGESVRTVTPTAGKFDVDVTLHADALNRIYFTAIRSDGSRAPSVVAAVFQDSTAPQIFIDEPLDGAAVARETVDVVGRVGDARSGAGQVTVMVNGIAARVEGGVGPNGTYLAANIPLVEGANALNVVATDEFGHTTTVSRTVMFVGEPVDEARMQELGGNRQIGVPGEFLPAALRVRVLGADGTPMVSKLVSFEVVRSNGALSTAPELSQSRLLQVRTDAQGIATAYWRLGGDVGAGNHRVRVFSTGIAGGVTFCASAQSANALQINIGSGNLQTAMAGGPAAEKLRVWVSDSCNGIAGIPVSFVVREGGGKVNGFDNVVVKTDSTGHADVALLLGATPGTNTVVASFGGQTGGEAVFIVRGVASGPMGAETTMSGLVLDNARCPIESATVFVRKEGVVVGTTPTLPDGRFHLTLPSAGVAELVVDGRTATAVNGSPVQAGAFPELHFAINVVSGMTNDMPMPILLPRLDPANERSYSTTKDIELTVAGIEGLVMTVKANSMKIGGVPAPDGTKISLNAVHHDDVPMPMPDGAAPPFAWTFQPAGAVFDPPVAIRYPNMTGAAPGAVGNFLTFNHATGRFEIVATGVVSADGSILQTDPGSGLSLAGWGCNCPPYSVTGSCEMCCTSTGVTTQGLVMICETPCCTEGPVESFQLDVQPFEFGPFDIPIVDIHIPQFTAAANAVALRQQRCCTGIEGMPVPCCVQQADLEFSGGASEFNVNALGGLGNAIKNYICPKIERFTFGVLECEVSVEISVGSIETSGRLRGVSNPVSMTNGWAGVGILKVNDIAGTATVSGTLNIPGLDPIVISGSLAISDAVSATLVAVGDRLEIRNLGNAGPTISGEFVIDVPFADEIRVPANHQFTDFRGTVPTFSIPLPSFPTCN